MWWVAALLSAIVWVLAWSSGFLGPVAHVFLLLALLAGLAQVLSMLPRAATTGEAQPPNDSPAPAPVATRDQDQPAGEASGHEHGRDGAE